MSRLAPRHAGADAAGTPTMAWLLAAAALLLGVATVSADLDVGTWLVLAATALTGIAIFFGQVLGGVFTRRSVRWVLLVGVASGSVLLVLTPAVEDSRYVIATLALGALGLFAILAARRWSTIAFVVVVAGHFALMSWVVAARGDPPVDVHQFQEEAASALLDRSNPYALRYKNRSGPGSPYYSPELEDGDLLTFGFVYPPLSLAMALPGHLLAGDYRYSAVAAISATALLIGLARASPLAIGAGLLVLFSPITPRIVYWGWSEPFVAVLLAATTVAALRARRTVPWMLGLLVASKQYVGLVWLVGLALLRQVRERVGWRRLVSIPLLVAAATVLPFLAWDFGRFVYSTVVVHNLQPFREDSWSVPALLVRAGFEPIPSWIGFALAAATLAAVVWRAERTPAGFAGGSMLVLLVFFLFGKQAHVNYYFLVIAGLAAAVAAVDLAPRPAEEVSA